MTEVEIFRDNPKITQIVIDKRGDTWLELYNPVLQLPDFTIDTNSDQSSADGNVSDAPDIPTAEEPEEVYHFLVTSSQLCNVSDYFEAMFAHNFQEASRNPEDSKFHIVAQELNLKALEILLNIAHCLVKKVPRNIEQLELLTHLSVAVDFYHMHDVVRMYSERWVEGLKISGHPLLDQDELANDPIMTADGVIRGRKAGGQGYDRKAVMWLQILRVFPDREMFREVCQLVIWHGRGPFQHLDLPVQTMAEDLDHARTGEFEWMAHYVDISEVSVFQYLKFLEHVSNTHDENDHAAGCNCAWTLDNFRVLAERGQGGLSRALQTLVDKVFPNSIGGTDGRL